MFIIKAVVKCIIEKEGKILLMKESPSASWKPGKWSLPGGKVESKESYVEATHREIHEETGLQVEVDGLLEIEELVGVIGEDYRLSHHYIFEAHTIDGRLKSADEHVAELKWFTKDELLMLRQDELTEYYYPSLFQKYIKGMKKLDLSVINVLNGFRDSQYQKWLNE